MIPDTQAPGPHEINNSLIDAVHRAILHHPSVEAKAGYGKILAQLLAHQQKAHAAHQTATSHAVQPPPAQGAGYEGGQGLAPPDQVDPSGGYVAQNVSPILQALIAHGGFQNAGQLPQLGGEPEGGLIGSMLAARHVPLPHWA